MIGRIITLVGAVLYIIAVLFNWTQTKLMPQMWEWSLVIVCVGIMANNVELLIERRGTAS
jgi:hypothetical protein